MKKIYYNDRGFQLGNLLYLLLQAHKDRTNNKESYVLRTGYYKFAITLFPKLEELFSKANGLLIDNFGYYQKHNKDFSSEHLDSFCEKYLTKEIDKLSENIENKDITIAIRRTDFLNEKNRKFYGYDSIKYIKDCLNEIKDLKDLSVRITSDDPTWCKEVLVPTLQKEYNFNNPIEVEEANIRDNFLQLYSCDKYFISPNSTYCYWIGYLLRINKPNVQVFVPNFNTTLIDNGKQIADIRGWKTIEVDRTDF